MPKYNETLDILEKYRSRWTTTPGLNMDQEIEKLRGRDPGAWDGDAVVRPGTTARYVEQLPSVAARRA